MKLLAHRYVEIYVEKTSTKKSSLCVMQQLTALYEDDSSWLHIC